MLLDQAFDRALQGSGVDRRGWQVLTSLSQGPVSEADLVASLRSFDAAPVVAGTVSNLTDRGWVEEHSGVLRLTPEGTSRQAALAPAVTDIRRRVSAALPQEDYVVLVQLLARLTESLTP